MVLNIWLFYQFSPEHYLFNYLVPHKLTLTRIGPNLTEPSIIDGNDNGAKLCDSCKSASTVVFCRADSAFLYRACDADVHAANELASRHGRVWICEVCEQAPASFTCKAAAAALHSANPLARCHDHLPVSPFYDADAAAAGSEEEAEAASWLLLDPNSKIEESGSPKYMSVFSDVDPYLDQDLKCKPHQIVSIASTSILRRRRSRAGVEQALNNRR